MYKVYGRVRSRAARVLWLLEELGVPYEHIDVGPHDPQVVALNGSGKVPVLVDGEHMITDSSAIMTYLADKHGDFTYPAGTIERAKQDALFHTVLDEIDAVLWVAARHSFVLPEDKRIPAVIDCTKWEFERNLARLEARMEGPFLQGDKMTISDILLTHCLNWAHGAGFPVTSRKIKDYAKEMRARPAFQRTFALAPA